MELKQGSVWAWSPGNGRHVEIKSAAAVCRVDYGEALIRAYALKDSAGGSEVLALNGRIVSDDRRGHSIEVPAGHMVTATAEGGLESPREQPLAKTVRMSSVWGGRTEVWQLVPMMRDELLAEIEGPRVRLGLRAIAASSGAGLEVTSVDAGSPCAAAGVRTGDIVVGVNGHPIETLADLAASELRVAPSGALRVASSGEVRLALVRDGQKTLLSAGASVDKPAVSDAARAYLTRGAEHLAADNVSAAELQYARATDADSECTAAW